MSILEFLDWGIAGVFAICMFLVYRRVCNQMRDDRKYTEDRLTGVIENYHEDSREHTEAKVKNTQVLSELITWLKARNGKSKE